MPVAILPDISEQHCIGCALCVEICTSLGPDVLRVKPVEGWKRGKAFVFYPERCISDGACIGVCPTKEIFWMRPMDYTPGQPIPLKKSGLHAQRPPFLRGGIAAQRRERLGEGVEAGAQHREQPRSRPGQRQRPRPSPEQGAAAAFLQL